MDDDVREVFRKRARIIKGIRRFLDDRGYLEVETPILDCHRRRCQCGDLLKHITIRWIWT